SSGSIAGLCLLYSSVSLSNACATFRWLLISMSLGWMRRRSRVANDRRSTCTAAATALANSKPTSNAVKELFLIDAGGTLLTALAACPICFLFSQPGGCIFQITLLDQPAKQWLARTAFSFPRASKRLSYFLLPSPQRLSLLDA